MKAQSIISVRRQRQNQHTAVLLVFGISLKHKLIAVVNATVRSQWVYGYTVRVCVSARQCLCTSGTDIYM